MNYGYKNKVHIYHSFTRYLVVSSCGNKKNKKTSTKIVLGNFVSGDAALVSGGIMIFGVHKQSPKRIAIRYTGQTLELPNGDWDFAALAWQTQAFAGTQRCALASARLNGSDVQVPIDLDPATCTNSFFGSPETKTAAGVPHPLSFATCGNLKCLFGNGDTNKVSIKGVAKSYVVIMPGFEDGPNGASPTLGVNSACFTPGSNTTDPNSTSAIKFPILAFPVPTVIRAYDLPGCQGGYDQYDLFDGLKNPIPEVTWFNTIAGVTNEIRLKSNICRAENPAGTTYRLSTTGTSGNIEQHIICNANQMDNMVTEMATIANQDDIYVLGKDIDYTGVTPSGPIGNNTDNFRGIFEGNFHTISNYSATGATGPLGIFGAVNGFSNAQMAKIQNVTFNDISIELTAAAQQDVGIIGVVNDFTKIAHVNVNTADIKATGCTGGSECYNVGGLVGRVNPTTNSELFDIHVDDVAITAVHTLNAGGIIGRLMNNGSLRDATATNIKAISNNLPLSLLGGAVGDNDGEVADVVTSVSFDENIYNIDPTNSVGGVVGNTTTNSRIMNVKASGTIDLTGTDSVGGILGRSSASTIDTIVNAVSTVTINVGGTPGTDGQKVGGIAGDVYRATGASEMKFLRNFGTVTCVDKCGGIVGYLGDTGTGTVLLEQGHNYANVTATNNSAGGVIGELDAANTVAASRRKFLHNEGNVTAVNDAGGILGTRTSTGANQGKLTHAYNLGNITASTSNAGGVVGNTGPISVSEVNQVYSIGTISGGTATLTNFSDGGGAAVTCFYDSTDGTDGTAGQCTNVNATTDSIATYTGIDTGEFINDPTAGGSPVLLKWEDIEVIGASFLGSKADPFQISTTTQWNIIQDKPHFMDKAFKLVDNLDFQNGSVTFNPIGSTTTPFKGEFFGNNFTIRNVALTESSATDHLGVFRVIQANAQRMARFEDYNPRTETTSVFYLENINFTTDYAAGGSSVGIFAGYVADAAAAGRQFQLRGVEITGGSITASATENVGSFIGHLDLNNDNSMIQNVHSKAYIAGCGTNTGGLFGKIVDAGVTSVPRLDYFTFEGSFNASSCNSTTNTGGIVGMVSGPDIKIENAKNIANVTSGTNAGGIVGSATGVTLESSANTGNVSGGSAGGLIGYLTQSAILASYSYGAISGSTDAGCFVGQHNGGGSTTIDNSFCAPSSITGGTTDYVIGQGTFTVANTIYFPFAGETVTQPNVTIKPYADLTNVFATDMLDNGLADSPWVRFPGSTPQFHYEVFPEFFD
ncbi:MAG: hypothetical protein GY909_09315 [Oligoflexia bacterium]|nr:hypothetical protein [Oligoflexia bacterium]